MPEFKIQNSKLKTDHYTPRYIVDYLVAQTLGQYLKGKTIEQVQSLRCLEPSCGDGIFLLGMFDCLAAFYQAERDRLLNLLQQPDLTPLQRQQTATTFALTENYPYRILEQHLYGLDVDAQAVARACQNLIEKAENHLEGARGQGLGVRAGSENSKFAMDNRHPSEQSKIQNPKSKIPNVRVGNFLIANDGLVAVGFNEPLRDTAYLKTKVPFDWQREFPAVAREGGFDIVLGNPPYLGFNDYSGAEKAYFQHWYREVYNLKSDLLYYFLYRPAAMVKPGARLGYIVSRFWKEAAFAQNLRDWLATKTTLEQLVDLGKLQVFDRVNIDTCLIVLRYATPSPDQQFDYLALTNAPLETPAFIQARLYGSEGWQKVAQGGLSGRAWKIYPQSQQHLLDKIAAQSVLLGEICNCKTGVQTGNDRVFLPANPQILAGWGVEAAVLKPAIKNSQVERFYLAPSPLRLIYTDQQTDPALYPNLLRYLAPHRAELESRNRYRKHEIFPYYQLQWPRDAAIFEQSVKLVCPYKAPVNTFALDYGRHYFSTDVIAVVPLPDCPYSPAALLALLNSKLATFYFRSYSKPMGGGQYDYYADPVKKLPILRLPLPQISKLDPLLADFTACTDAKEWQRLGEVALAALDKQGLAIANCLLDFIATQFVNLLASYPQTPLKQTICDLLDRLVYRLYGLSEAEIAIIEGAL